jgi:hypothetical protein
MKLYTTFKTQVEILPRITVLYGEQKAIAFEWLWIGLFFGKEISNEAELIKEFQNQLIECMIFKPERHDEFYNSIPIWYKVFINQKDFYNVSGWAESFFKNASIKTGTYMLKSQA